MLDVDGHDLAALDAAFSGWRIDRGQLISSEGWQFTPGAIRAGVYNELRARTLEADLRAFAREPARPRLLDALAALDDLTDRTERVRRALSAIVTA